MVFPDYKRSVVNVACSVIDAFGGKPLYEPLKELDFIRDYEKIVLLVVDGLGYEFLQKNGQGSFLQKNCVAKITSTFPSTTAAAKVALETGVAPQQHAITGWNMLIKELGAVSHALFFEPRFGKINFESVGAPRAAVYTEKTIAQKIAIPSAAVVVEITKDWFAGFKDLFYFNDPDMAGMIGQIEKAAVLAGKHFIYAHWLELDHLCHKKGCASKEAIKHFWEIDHAVNNLAASLKEKNICLIVTADHGLIDVPQDRTIVLNDYPEIYGCLSLPLCGDTRAPYCYVRPDRAAKFKSAVKNQLGFCCHLRQGPDFIKRGVFGLGEPNPKLYERVGDYILVCKENYLIRDLLIVEKRPEIIGCHGGMSKEEMLVPLIISR